jgi:hypothetical protein
VAASLRLRSDAVMNKGAVVEDGLSEGDGDGVDVLGFAVAVLELGRVAIVDEERNDQRVSVSLGEIIVALPVDEILFIFV